MLYTALLLLSEAAAFQISQAPSRLRTSSILTQLQLESMPVLESVATETKIDLPPVLQGIVDERQEYHIKLGRAMDTLRNDMQSILTERPGMYGGAPPTAHEVVFMPVLTLVISL